MILCLFRVPFPIQYINNGYLECILNKYMYEWLCQGCIKKYYKGGGAFFKGEYFLSYGRWNAKNDKFSPVFFPRFFYFANSFLSYFILRTWEGWGLVCPPPSHRFGPRLNAISDNMIHQQTLGCIMLQTLAADVARLLQFLLRSQI